MIEMEMEHLSCNLSNFSEFFEVLFAELVCENLEA